MKYNCYITLKFGIGKAFEEGRLTLEDLHTHACLFLPRYQKAERKARIVRKYHQPVHLNNPLTS